MLTVCARSAPLGGLLFPTPAAQRVDRLAQRGASIGERIRASVVAQRKSGQHPRPLQLSQAGREDVRRHSQIALQIAVSLRAVEQPPDDEQRPPGTDDVEGCREVAHDVASESGFIQNGE